MLKVEHCRKNIIGPNRVSALPLGVAAGRSVRYFGLNRVCALPLGVAVDQSVQYFCDFLSLISSPPYTFLQEGFEFFHGVLIHRIIKILGYLAPS